MQFIIDSIGLFITFHQAGYNMVNFQAINDYALGWAIKRIEG